ncbi:MAG: diacylglycerol kinase family lipid kinase [Candidatus Omnitrophica bacterium]|nr:diacylglycerol kinase family lipid kinase [Candidatus Omnitrophota bacterium]
MKALVIYNPIAGPGQRTLQEALRVFLDHGWDITARETSAPQDAIRFAREAATAGYDAVIAVGGDGTLNEAANGVIGSQTALGVLPLGTVNVWAREMGLPVDDLPRAAQRLIAAQPRAVDVGEARTRQGPPRAFVLWCGVGFDALIVRLIEPQRDAKRRLGMLLFLLIGLKEAWGYRGRRTRLEVDGLRVRRRAILTLISNCQLYGGVVRIAADARIDDGALDVVMFKGGGIAQTAWHLIKVFLGWHRGDPETESYRGSAVSLRARGVPVHVDGELIGTTPVDIRVIPRGLWILVPTTANQALFSSDLVAEREEL